MPFMNIQSPEKLMELTDIYWPNIQGLSEEIFDRWETSSLHEKVKYATKMNSICSRFSGFFYDWNFENGWFLRDLIRFVQSTAELKKPDRPRHTVRYNMTYGERLEECLDDFHALVGGINTMKRDLFFVFQINEMLKMKAVTNEAIALFDDIFLKEGWYVEALEAHTLKSVDGSKGGFSLTVKNKKPAFKMS